MSAPVLSDGDIRQEVERIFSRDHRSTLVALYGSAAPGRVRVRDDSWTVAPTSCELELRSKMPLPGVNDRIVFVIDWTDRPLPVDLSARLAGGRVYQISRDTRLSTLFGARYAEPGLMSTGLAAVLLGGEITGLRKVTGLQVTRTEAYSAFIESWLGFEWKPAGLPELVAWCARDDRGPALGAKATAAQAWDGLRRELREFWRSQSPELGKVYELVWLAWEQNQGRRLVQLLLLMDAWNQARDPVARGLLLGRLGDLGPGFGPGLFEQIDALGLPELIPALRRLVAEPTWWQPLLAEAETLIPQLDFRPSMDGSLFLPAGHAARERSLAAAIRIALSGTDDDLRGAVGRLVDLSSHAQDASVSEDLRDARRMGVGLVLWLAERRRTALTSSHGPQWQQAVDLARRFVDEGGFVDWCRQRLRRPLAVGDSLRDALYEVLAAADSARRADDKAFAEAIPAWINAGRPSQDALPIDAVTRSLVAPLLERVGRRQLLVVLMDGMSWANAVQLLTRLARENWSPTAWRAPTVRGASQFPVVLAEVPTITAQSRAAFFAGRHDTGFGNRPTAEDLDRWRQNRALRGLVEAGVSPDLVLRAGLMNGEDLHDDVKAAVESAHRVVAVVVNAIDDQLKGSPQLGIDYSRVPIKPLEGLLHAADGAERAVLLVSDHGHVPGDGMKNHGQLTGVPTEGGRRWRVLRSGEEPLPFEVKLPADTWRPGDAASVAAIWDDTVAHGHPAFGEHGGVSLAEVVAPCILIAPDWLASKAGAEDPELACRDLLTPQWWRLDLPPVARRDPPPAPAVLPSPAIAAAIALFPEHRPAPAAPAPTAPVVPTQGPLALALSRSLTFKKQVANLPTSEVDRILKCIDALASDPSATLAEAVFAERAGILRRHVAGTVARLGILNSDGFSVVEHNVAGQQVILHRDRLAQQFGLER
jgi:hypothetical protein